MRWMMLLAVLGLGAQTPSVFEVESNKVYDAESNELVIAQGQVVEIRQTDPNGVVVINATDVKIDGELRWNGWLCIRSENYIRIAGRLNGVPVRLGPSNVRAGPPIGFDVISPGYRRWSAEGCGRAAGALGLPSERPLMPSAPLRR